MAEKQPIKLFDLAEKPTFDLAAIRQKLANTQGQHYWRSLDEIAQTPEFQNYVDHEFPHWSQPLTEAVSRRNFLKFMGASMAMMGLSGCNSILHPQPLEQIAPYTKQPEGMTPGKPLFFATAMPLGGYATGLLVESNMGRPTKVEGNPEHPASLGATDLFAQASILTMYDPERSQTLYRNGRISSWQILTEVITKAMTAQAATKGAGLRILTETVTSPTLADQLKQLLEKFPSAKWHQYEAVMRDNVREGAMLAFGEAVNTLYHFDKAKVVLSLDADFLTSGPGWVRYARDFMQHRRVRDGETHEMSRFYAVESTPTGTGSIADNRLPLQARQVQSFASMMIDALGIGGTTDKSLPEHAEWIAAAAADLQAHKGESIVIAGEYQSPAVHALAHQMNQALGNVGKTVIYTDPVEANSVNQIESLKQLTTDMAAGSVELLLILGGNPVFDAPTDLNFAASMDKVALRIHLGLYQDETANLCHWHVPQTFYLEDWSDARAYDGTVTVIQPLIAPLYDGHSPHELISLLTAGTLDNYKMVNGYWQAQAKGDNFEKMWQTTIHDGVMKDSAFAEKSVTLKTALDLPKPLEAQGLEINFRPDPTIWDGRFINNGWLQEIPKPLTKVTWDNVAMISPSLAEKEKLSTGDVVALNYQGRAVRAPIWVMPGHAPDSVTIHFGYGRTRTGKVGEGTGFNAYTLRTSDSPWFATGLEMRKLNDYYQLASTQTHQSMEGRDIVRVKTLEELAHGEEGHEEHAPMSLMPDYPYNGNAWGMVVDLGSCTGCNACVAACDAENNIAVVGKEEVMMGREMQWLRIDSYYSGDLDNPTTLSQPVMCQHCEQAPCEVVCPVAATVHSAEGLNDMVYNRCVGTRFCANNCPYKVRHFNFYQYQDTETPIIGLRHNPDVTVRSRGVMEKCSYCVQRINEARIEAKKEARDIRDGEVVTACQQACPTQAIVFGNINDHNSQVYKLKQQSQNYGLLAELNTRPRTTYLTKVTNPKSEIKQGDA